MSRVVVVGLSRAPRAFSPGSCIEITLMVHEVKSKTPDYQWRETYHTANECNALFFSLFFFPTREEKVLFQPNNPNVSFSFKAGGGFSRGSSRIGSTSV